MKVSKEQRTHNKEQILKAASKLYREHGIDGIGIGELTKSVGLTHGGFYRQFPDGKEQLVSEAIARSFDDYHALWSSKSSLAEVVESYVCDAHRDNKLDSCPIPTLAADVSRMGGVASESWTQGLQRLLNTLKTCKGRNGQLASEAEALQVLASISGAMIIAKASNDPELNRKLISAVVDQWCDDH